jgi:hypothetical protein
VIVSIVGVIGPIVPVRASPSWSSPVAVQQSDPYNAQFPSALQASNGSVWLAWQTNAYRGDSLYDIAYKTGTLGTVGITWGPVNRLSNNAFINASPSLAQLQNGTILVFFAYKAGSSYQIYYERYGFGGSWSSAVQVTSTTLNDTYVSATVGRDGTLWLVWTRVNSTCPSCGVTKQLYYKSLKGNVWSSETQLTNDANWNFGSKPLVGKDGLVRVVWAKGQSGPDNFQIYYKNYNGSAWSSETQIVTSTTEDTAPSLMQDRNGTLWLFWARKIVVSTLLFYHALYSKYSFDNGQSWSAETQLTNTANTIESFEPSGIQSTNDKKIWLFYATNPTVANFEIWALTTVSPIAPVCDVGVYSFNPVYNAPNYYLQIAGGLKSINQSPLVSINVTLFNYGDAAEIVQVTLAISNTTTYSVSGYLNVPNGGYQSSGTNIRWNTTGVKPALYNIKATVAIITPSCTVTLGNQPDLTLSQKNVMRILPLGDPDQDGWISIIDAGIFIRWFDYPTTAYSLLPLCDIDNNGYIDIIDVGVVEVHFGFVS